MAPASSLPSKVKSFRRTSALTATFAASRSESLFLKSPSTSRRGKAPVLEKEGKQSSERELLDR